MGNPKTNLRSFPHIDHPSFRDPATDAVLFPAGAPLPTLPPVIHLGLDYDEAHAAMPVLSREDERRLFTGYNLARHRAAQAQERGDGRELALWAGRADHVREYLVRCNTGLVAHSYHLRRKLAAPLDPDDVFSAGLVALARCVDKFDGSRGFKFSTYAVGSILREIGRLAKSSATRAARLPTHRLPTCRAGGSAYAAGGGRVGARVEAEDTAATLRLVLDSNAAGLTPNERHVIRQRYFATPQLTQSDTGRLLGVTKARVQQIEVRALSKLRAVVDPALAA